MKRVILASDTHYCDPVWYGVDAKTRNQHLVDSLNEEYRKNPYDWLLMLGDYSLDFWICPPFGSVLNRQTSFTEKFMREFYPQLPPCRKYMLAGNHEQYGEENWKRITGFSRQAVLPYGDYVFLMLDAFRGNLDPTENSDGTYVPMDTDFIRGALNAYPNHRFFLCAHDFYLHEESEAFCDLIRTEPRIIALFGGHTHYSHVIPLGEKFGNKCLLRDGQYSYSPKIEECRWGFREICFCDDGSVVSAYITPEATIMMNGKPDTNAYGRQDVFTLIEAE